MYTFIALIIFSFLLSSLIFNKKLKDNIINMFFIVVMTTFIGMTTVNGILGSKLEYTPVEIERYAMVNQNSRIIQHIDSAIVDTTYISGCIKYSYINDTIRGKYLNILKIHEDITYFDTWESDEVDLHFLAENDTIPYIIETQDRKLSKNKWTSNIGLPRRNTKYHVYIPRDSTHIKLMDYINLRFYKKEEINLASN